MSQVKGSSKNLILLLLTYAFNSTAYWVHNKGHSWISQFKNSQESIQSISEEQINLASPTYTVVNAVIEKKEDGLTLTVVAVVGEEGSPRYIGVRLILFGGATALEGKSVVAGPPSPVGSAEFTYSITRTILTKSSTRGD